MQSVQLSNPTQQMIATTSDLRRVSTLLEENFLFEMLKSSGMGKPQDVLGGGQGEEQFSSFLIQAQVKNIVKSGGIGLAEAIFNSLKGK